MPKVTKQARNGGRELALLLAAVGIAFCAAFSVSEPMPLYPPGFMLIFR